MHRCVSKALALTALAVGASFSISLSAQAQTHRQFPPQAMRGELMVTQAPDINLNGQATRLSPGSRIRDANNLLAMLWTWQNGDISDNPVFKGDFKKALGAIKAKAVVMPGEMDLYFPVADNVVEVSHMPNAECCPIPGVWGHFAGGGAHSKDTAFIDAKIKALLER